MNTRHVVSNISQLELGKYPVHISIISKIIKFWHRMANLHESCLLKQAYNVELCYLKFVYDNMKLGDMEDYFLDPSKSSASFIANKITKILEDRFIKFWCRTVWSGICNTNAQSGGNKLRLYRHFKKLFKLGGYLTNIKNDLHRKALCQFRISAHSLMREVGRYCKISPMIMNNGFVVCVR